MSGAIQEAAIQFANWYRIDQNSGYFYERDLHSAFKAGADWQREQHGTYNDGYEQGRQHGPDYAPLPQLNPVTTFQALMAMLEQINKVAVEAKAESHTRLGAFHQIMERIEKTLTNFIDHKAVCDRDAILATVVGVGQKVDAVLDHVTPKASWVTLPPHNGCFRMDQDENGKPLTEGVPLEENENFTSFGKTMPIGYCGLVPPKGVAEERGPVRLGSEGKGNGPYRKHYAEKGSTMFGLERALVDDDVVREPVTDESGISVGAGAGPLIKDTPPADQLSEFISAIEAIKAGQRFSIYRSAGLSEEEFNFLHKRLIYRGWTILENIADMKWEMIPPYRAT